MAFETTLAAQTQAQKGNKQTNIVLEIDGVDTVLSTLGIKQILKIGDPAFILGPEISIGGLVELGTVIQQDPVFIGEATLLIGPDFTIGGVKEFEGQLQLVSYDAGTTTTLSQTIKQDTGEGSTVSRYQIAVVDKDGVITELISPGKVVTDVLGKKCRVWFGFVESAWKEDYIIMHRGFIRSIKSKAGVIKFDIAHADLKKKNDIFVTGETALSAPLTDVETTTMNVDDSTNFLEKITGPNGLIDDTFNTYVRIDDEVIEYETKGAGVFTTLTRGAFGTTAASHSVDASIASVYQLGVTDAMDIALKVLLSGKEGPYKTDVNAANFVRVDNSTLVSNAILFKQDIVLNYNVQIGDFLSAVGALNGANNVVNAEIVAITENSAGTYVTLADTVSLVEEVSTDAEVSFRSQFDVWPTGAGLALDNDFVDIDEHKRIQRLFLSSFEYDFRLTETTEAKEFLQAQLYNPASCFELPRKAQASVGIHTPPLPGSRIKDISKNTVLNADKLELSRSTTEEFFNTINYKFEEDLENEFRRGEIFISADSIARLPDVGNKSLTIEAKGMREILSAKNLADQAATRRLNKYKFGAEFVNGINLDLSTGWDVEGGDAVVLDIPSLEMSDTVNATRGTGDSRVFDIKNKKFNTKTGVVTIDVVDSNADKDARYGLISGCSFIKSGINNISWIIQPSFNTDRFGNDEWRKWTDFVGASVLIRSSDFTTTGTGTLSSIAGNTITVSSTIGFVPAAGFVMELDKYSNQPDSVKLLFAFMSDDSNDFADGGKPYVLY